MANKRQTKPLPDELQDVATTGQLSDLEAHLNKAYSSERYEEFQAAVEKIFYRAMETESAHAKLETKIQTEIKKYLEEKGWKNKNFWIPTAIGVMGVIVAIVAIALKRS